MRTLQIQSYRLCYRTLIGETRSFSDIKAFFQVNKQSGHNSAHVTSVY